MKLRSSLLLSALTLSVTTDNLRADTTRYFAGSFCQGASSGDTTAIGRNNLGCWNTITSCPDGNATVILPMYWPDTTATSKVNYQGAKVTYYKENVASLSCQIVVTQYNNLTLFTSSVQSSTSTGWGVLQWTGAGLPNGGSDITSTSQMHVVCTLPARKYDAIDGVCPELRNYIVGYELTTVDY